MFGGAGLRKARGAWLGRGATNGFDRGGLIGQWFFNVGHVSSWGQAGLFATWADFDEPVVKTVPFEPTLYEETYLKVSSQAGINLQVKAGARGYVEGTLGCVDTTWLKRRQRNGALRSSFDGQARDQCRSGL